MLQPISAVQVDIKEGEEQLKSYKNYIQSMFPIMRKGWLEDLGEAISTFLEKPSVLPEKRSACNSNIFPPLRERSPTTALILLVFALGKICDWKAPFPELGLVGVRNWDGKGLRTEVSSPAWYITQKLLAFLGTSMVALLCGVLKQEFLLLCMHHWLDMFITARVGLRRPATVVKPMFGSGSPNYSPMSKICTNHAYRGLDGKGKDMVKPIFWTCIQLEKLVPASL